MFLTRSFSFNFLNPGLILPKSMNRLSYPKVLRARLHFDYASTNVREVASIERAILPESTNKGKCVLKTSLKKDKKAVHLLLDFESADIISLRASINTNLRLVNSAIRTLHIIDSNGMLVSDRGKTEKLGSQS